MQSAQHRERADKELTTLHHSELIVLRVKMVLLKRRTYAWFGQVIPLAKA
jgi:hypothetical protein